MDIGVIVVPKIPKSQFIKVYSVAHPSTLFDMGAYFNDLKDRNDWIDWFDLNNLNDNKRLWLVRTNFWDEKKS